MGARWVWQAGRREKAGDAMWLTLGLLALALAVAAAAAWHSVTRVRMLHRRLTEVEARPDLTERAAELERRAADLRSQVEHLARQAGASERRRHLSAVPAAIPMGPSMLVLGLLAIGLAGALAWWALAGNGDPRRGAEVAAPPPATAPPPPPTPGPGTDEAERGPSADHAGVAARNVPPQPAAPPPTSKRQALPGPPDDLPSTATTVPSPTTTVPATDDCAARVDLPPLLDVCLL